MKRKSDTKKRAATQGTETSSSDDSSRSRSERPRDALAYAKSIGYSEAEMKSVPDGAAVTHGCGNPAALADLREGETVLDLGCGGGLDVFLAARRVGAQGRAIGLDAASEAIDKAKTNAKAGDYRNVEFLVAKIEELPLADGSVDVVISNCVINDSSDKVAAFREAHRVLKPGGQMFVSDLVTTGKLPDDVLRKADKLWADWLAMASDRREYLDAIAAGGFQNIVVTAEGPFPLAEADNLLQGRIISIQVTAAK